MYTILINEYYYTRYRSDNSVLDRITRIGKIACQGKQLSPPRAVNLGCVNKYFYNLMSHQPIIKQWLIIKKKQKNMYEKLSIDGIFLEICINNFLSYGMFIIKEEKNKINIHIFNEQAFKWSCEKGHIEINRWLIQLGESGDYGKKINIHSNHEHAFRLSCFNGHIEIAQWLIQLGESGNYGKINIHADNDFAFKGSCINGHIEIAQWLIHLGESGNYSKINIHANNEYAFGQSCRNGYIEIAHW